MIVNGELKLTGEKLVNLDFLAKFLRQNPNVEQVDLDAPKAGQEEFRKVKEVIEASTNVSKFTIRGDKMGKAMMKELRKEIDKNKSVANMIRPNVCADKLSLNLTK